MYLTKINAQKFQETDILTKYNIQGSGQGTFLHTLKKYLVNFA